MAFRDEVFMTNNDGFPDLHPLLNPASIAVVGASENKGPGRQVIENLRQLGYAGAIYPINPKYETIFGLPCYPSLTAVGEAGLPVDLAAVLLGRDAIVPVLEEGGRIGIKAAWAFAAGFGEAGPEGKELQGRLVRVCGDNNILFCGPNCVGFLNPNGRSGAYSAPAPERILSGGIGIVAQSGYLCIALANSGRELGLSLLCSTGNEAVLDSTDYIAHMVKDPGTRVIAAFIEQFRDPKKLVRVAEAADRAGKPIVLIKVGRSELARSATAAHTGALAGSDDVQDALFKKLGILRVKDLEEMFETAELFSKLQGKLPEGNRIFALTLSGGVISLLGDLSEGMNLKFPGWSEGGKARVAPHLPPFAGISNPLDAWGYGRIEEAYPLCLQAAAEEPAADIVLVVQDLPNNMASRQVDQYSIVARAAVGVKEKSGKPVIGLSNTAGGLHRETRRIFDEGGVPLLEGTRPALMAVEAWIGYGQRKRRIADMAKENGGAADRGPAGGIGFGGSEKPYRIPVESRGPLSEYESKVLLRDFGIPCPDEALCGTAAEAARAAERLGYPVALKVMSRDIPHKTEAKVVALGIADRESLNAAYTTLLRNAAAYNRDARIDGVLCQKMISGAVAEAIVGVIRDPNFGPAVVFGLGGVMVEVLRDRSVGVPPLSRRDALDMIESVKGYSLLTGFRGRPKGDLEATAEIIRRAGDLALALGDRLEALDINPVMIMPEGRGAFPADALVILRE
jgi:acyl-CoA synthetase (NDP forming)